MEDNDVAEEEVDDDVAEDKVEDDVMLPKMRGRMMLLRMVVSMGRKMIMSDPNTATHSLCGLCRRNAHAHLT